MVDQDRIARLVRIDDLRRCLAVAFERLQLTREDAEGLAGLLVDSELRGHPGHGVAALGVLAGFYRDGTLNPHPSVRVLHETDGAPGNLLWALDVEAFMPRQEFLERMDAQLDQVKQGERLAGVEELLVPGERGQRRYLDLTARGVVPLAPASWQLLTTDCESLGAPLPTVLND
jgi:LDH2 family malate/lactate/ureidoglycolate dehydrogenase